MQVSVTHETQEIPGVTWVVVRETGLVDGGVTADPCDDQAQKKPGSVYHSDVEKGGAEGAKREREVCSGQARATWFAPTGSGTRLFSHRSLPIQGRRTRDVSIPKQIADHFPVRSRDRE
jgi:hypothetical protein